MFKIKIISYVGEERCEEEGGHDEHDAETNHHQSLPASLLNEDQRHECHGHVHGSHAQGGRLTCLNNED